MKSYGRCFSSECNISFQNSSMYNWIKAGCPRDRLIIGIPGYGRAFAAPGNDPVKAYGQPGSASSISSPYLGETGLLAFYEVEADLTSF